MVLVRRNLTIVDRGISADAAGKVRKLLLLLVRLMLGLKHLLRIVRQTMLLVR
ncbi:hypothetical protein D3C81_2260120 [compost metagenome]